MKRFLCRAMVVALALEVVLAIPFYFSVLNFIGPSTDYYEPYIDGKVTMRPDGKYEAFLGDGIFVRYIVVRHKINGNCLMRVYRYGEEIGGPMSGKLHLLDYAELRFVGKDELRRPRWPLEHNLILGYDVNKDGQIQDDKPLLAPGRQSQQFALYVKARYFCNFMDYLVPRYLQGGIRPNETERVNLIVKRKPNE